MNLGSPWAIDVSDAVINGVKLQRYLIHGSRVTVDAIVAPRQPASPRFDPNRASQQVGYMPGILMDVERMGARQNVVDSENSWLTLTGTVNQLYTYEGDRLILNIGANLPAEATSAVADAYYSNLIESYGQTGRLRAVAEGEHWKAAGFRTFVIRINGSEIQEFPL